MPPITFLPCDPISPPPSLPLIMETTGATRGRAEIDTSRPFQSVREAVGVFGGEHGRVPGGGSSTSSSKFSVPPAASPTPTLLCCLRKLEAELAEARSELAELKQRQSQMETAVSSVSAQFANSLGIFSVGLDKGKQLAVVDGSAMVGAEEEEEYGDGRVRSDLWVEDARAEEWMASLEYLPSLSEALSIKMIEDDFDLRKAKSDKKAQKKKQRKIAVSLVRGLFSKKGRSR
uniref:Uncharacterized protein n=1 Tax=Avena sativa TaxID=4498 RepID=A0ACD5YWN9_AVESA